MPNAVSLRGLVLASLWVAALASAQPLPVEPLRPLAPESLSVTADAATEDRDARVFRVEGHVQVSGSDWDFTADRATLQGALDDAEQLQAQGSPARIRLRNTEAGSEVREVEGQARDISYRRHEDVLHLRGEASLRRDANTLTSEDIEYRRKNDLFRAGGAGGVRLTITPGQRRSAETPRPQQ